MKKLKLINKLHHSTKRNYLKRMTDNKIHCMKIAKKYEFDYWDGNRKYGYGGYKFIPGRWTPIAKKIIKHFKLNNNSKILDAGCGKGYLLYEIKQILPNIKIVGFDISRYGIKNSHPKIKKYLFNHDINQKTNFKNKEFDLVISLGCLHNLKIYNLVKTIREIVRIGKKNYIMVESYRNDKELFNLQCWALTCQSFFSDDQWIWLLKSSGYKGCFEFIHFK
ncbi:class I SAM-dependent methyltransferase [bacterium]|nr:class I SAM-dependent methyltransferase [bacterium]